MKGLKYSWLLMSMVILLLVACGGDEPAAEPTPSLGEVSVSGDGGDGGSDGPALKPTAEPETSEESLGDTTLGEVLLVENFDAEDAWETFANDEGTIKAGVVNGRYEINNAGNGYIWGLNDELHSDVVIEVTTEQLSTFEDNGYGVMCRADTSNNGDGYYFLVSGDGFVSIRRGEGDSVTALSDWDENSLVNSGQSINQLKAVCVGSKLELYVNGDLAAEAIDTTYTSGFAGFAAASAEENAHIAFDNLTIREGR
ncbi:MAG TPA: hypothetical protein VLL52_07650 [Anaerolineae bacterium]|nr:hypothetical protein [Anaerolineae bacterium]